MSLNLEILEFPGGAILPGAKALITFKAETPSRELFQSAKTEPIEVGVGKKVYEVVSWGRKNNLPQIVAEKMYASEVVSSNIEFNVATGYGQGITPAIYEYDAQGRRIARPFYDNPEINDWLEENDVASYLLEQLTDMKMYFNVFPEIILSADKKRITNIYSKEAMFSRWEKMDDAGVIRRHFYSAHWGEMQSAFSPLNPLKASKKDYEPIVTPVLDSRFPLRDLRERMGSNTSDRRFIVTD